MDKREKVINGLETIVADDKMWRKADYYATICKDALELLKAQELITSTPDAEWLLFKGKRGATCSYCKRTYDDVYDIEHYDDYCRHCGARMVRMRTVKWE